ncbi:MULTISPECIES: hypothetical protein [unclassified Streptomyces]|uniref:hypothetical protein n=1 Tax=Streptomyces sp. ST1020 TaxID=1848901 RepID=UPI000DDC2627|nr:MULTISPECIES: hypothetical protein [unclassified Streptomyces]QZZ29720.1 hypothetical protein A7X85_28870 [Streptomyces sp. ST1015]
MPDRSLRPSTHSPLLREGHLPSDTGRVPQGTDGSRAPQAPGPQTPGPGEGPDGQGARGSEGQGAEAQALSGVDKDQGSEGRGSSAVDAARDSEGQGSSGAEGAQEGRGVQEGREGQGGRDGRGGNPFAPPPEGAPDQPWRPREPSRGEGGDGEGGSPWGRWSDRQPGRSQGGFGDRPGAGPEGQGGNQAPGPRWDPTDPAQRRARYSLLGGMWAFFFVLFGWAYVALLLGALSLYWAISALRARPRQNGSDSPAVNGPANPAAPGNSPGSSGSRPQTTAAITGLVTASLALALVGAGFAAQLVYRDYYTCRADALTNEAQQSCDDLLPKQLRELLGTTD